MRRLSTLYWRLFFSFVLITAIGMAVLIAVAHLMTVIVVSGTTADPSISAITPTEAAFIRIIDQGVVAAAGTALIVAAVVSLYLSRQMIRPIRELSAASEQMAEGSYHVRVDVGANDELAALSRHMNQLAAALDQTEQRRLALLADVAHELRTPIMTIASYAEGMIDGVIPMEPASLALIQRETTRMRRLVEDLSLLSRAEAGQLSVSLQPVDLAAMIDYLVAQITPQCEDQDLTLTVVLPHGLPPVLADPQRIEQVLINVLVNAVRYTPAGGKIRISADLPPSVVRLIVRDTGVGIAPENLSLIFDRFYRVDASRSRHSGGTGVGLAIARHLMRAQGGDIWAESPGVGAGSVFFIALPIASYNV